MPIDPRELSKMAGDPWLKNIPPSCPNCGYILVGAQSSICAECGQQFQHRNVEKFATDLQMEIRRFRDMNEMVDWSLKLVIAGGVILALGVLRSSNTPSLGEVARSVAIVIGFVAMALGLNVLRVNRLPYWAREHLPENPKLILGQITGVLGLALIAAGVLIP